MLLGVRGLLLRAGGVGLMGWGMGWWAMGRDSAVDSNRGGTPRENGSERNEMVGDGAGLRGRFESGGPPGREKPHRQDPPMLPYRPQAPRAGHRSPSSNTTNAPGRARRKIQQRRAPTSHPQLGSQFTSSAALPSSCRARAPRQRRRSHRIRRARTAAESPPLPTRPPECRNPSARASPIRLLRRATSPG